MAVKYGVATQSTDRLNASDGFASLAIDGNINGAWSGRSVTHTVADATLDPEPWWQVDLSNNYKIETIKIYNRTDNCCSDRLNNFTVEVIDTNDTVTFSQFYATVPSNAFTVTTGGVVGNIVRISKTSADALSLAEVEVYGVDSVVTLSNNKFELNNTVKLYPNPANDILNITNAQGLKVSIYSILGEQVLTTKLEQANANATIDISSLKTGVYFVKTANANRAITKKIIKRFVYP
ncbi:T9SS type A sorting domain-containing protein [Flavivirga aquimarina]|uniref:T9SS type A sorting domain-containing protein n=1 Tax=Flavivirga aquimarina TaxID=2027862 RepID=A0ABT8W562_9FLAO|nr:T9SS type A sorting domain-containing protein [Flavivirga aquimarina]MDO5968245.1 T9SS type A sorting domain-containing protein [Flavivirga aquimarina]